MSKIIKESVCISFEKVKNLVIILLSLKPIDQFNIYENKKER